MVDDDLDMNALTKTNYVKSICNSRIADGFGAGRKNKAIRDCFMYASLCFSNGVLTALHDRSDGFFRRQIILTTKDKPVDRFDDPFLARKLIAEKRESSSGCWRDCGG